MGRKKLIIINELKKLTQENFIFFILFFLSTVFLQRKFGIERHHLQININTHTYTHLHTQCTHSNLFYTDSDGDTDIYIHQHISHMIRHMFFFVLRFFRDFLFNKLLCTSHFNQCPSFTLKYRIEFFFRHKISKYI